MRDDQLFTVVASRNSGLTVLRAGAFEQVQKGLKKLVGCNAKSDQSIELMTGEQVRLAVKRQREEIVSARELVAENARGNRNAVVRFSAERRAILEVLATKLDGMSLIPLSEALGKKSAVVCNLMRYMVRDGGLVAMPAKKGGAWRITQAGLDKLS